MKPILIWSLLSILLPTDVGGGRRLAHRLAASRPTTPRPPYDGCRCVPDQWQGVMTTTEHEFDLHDGQHVETGSHVRVYYDYTNRKFATRDIVTGHRSVADYAAVRETFFLILLSSVPSKRVALACPIGDCLAQ